MHRYGYKVFYTKNIVKNIIYFRNDWVMSYSICREALRNMRFEKKLYRVHKLGLPQKMFKTVQYSEILISNWDFSPIFGNSNLKLPQNDTLYEYLWVYLPRNTVFGRHFESKMAPGKPHN